MAKAKKYEGSAKDMANDKRMAKKKGMSLKAWESSKADARMDAAMQKKMDMKAKSKSRKKKRKA